MYDILNTGRTFSEAAKIVEREGATEIYAVSSHGLFVEGAAELLDNTNIKEILVTDSVATKEKTPKNVCYITASELIGDATSVFTKENQSAHSLLTTKRNKVIL